ncbi:8-oxo-dGTP diphosphatase [Paracoccus isoporae]|uniref:8-oxo-dGTP diphosphatase n=1 Tax=Paracoccus isoporae TaxID=591205 RepID=A0A1G6V4E0_9RHOB|nr:NUDIX hydrolase [Paracoccus isoporae]SDD48520.1 8-oxo-dGTP diphosphatase [Paracoccus isoporae]
MSGDLARPRPWSCGDGFVATKLILLHGDDLLTYLRDDRPDIPHPAQWDLPGGGREGDESAADCALRELAEEFGLHFSADRLRAPVAFTNPARPDYVSVFYCGALRECDIAAIRFGDEGICWRMMRVADYIVHPAAVPHFRARVAHCLSQARSELDWL